MDMRLPNPFADAHEDEIYFTHYHIRVYRDADSRKLRLEALDAPIEVEDATQHLTMGLNLTLGKAVVNFYLDDDVSPDKVRPAMPKIWLKFRDYFLGANA